MKKIMLSMVLFLSVGTIMGQVDKEALKAAQKEAKAQMSEANKINEAITAKINEKSVSDEEILTQCKKGQSLIRKAIKSDALASNKLGEAYKISADLAQFPNNILLNQSQNKQTFDTAYFYSNLKILTDALQGEIKYTKVTKGEAGNENYLKTKKSNLAQCVNFYLFAAQLNSECGKYDKTLEAFEKTLNYEKIYPEVAGAVTLQIPAEQVAYYAFHTAHEAKMYDKMEAYYDRAMQYTDNSEMTKQVMIESYRQSNESLIQMLIAYYLKKDRESGEESNLMMPYVDEIIAKDPNVLIAYYGKAYKLFELGKFDEAFDSYLKCTELKSDYFDAWYQCGLCKYRKALALNETISSIKNQVEAKKTLEKTKNIFGEAIPYFEKARECAPDEPQKWAYELRQCYSVTGQAAKAAEMDKLL